MFFREFTVSPFGEVAFLLKLPISPTMHGCIFFGNFIVSPSVETMKLCCFIVSQTGEMISIDLNGISPDGVMPNFD